MPTGSRTETRMSGPLTARAIMLRGLCHGGIFPWPPRPYDPELHWFEPTQRGVLPSAACMSRARCGAGCGGFGWQTSIDRISGVVVQAVRRSRRTGSMPGCWQLYAELFAMGHAHSLEIRQDGALIGGVFGLSLGGAFLPKACFSPRQCLKAALIWLSAHLALRFRAVGHAISEPASGLDGRADDRPREYRQRLAAALTLRADFTAHAPARRSGLVAGHHPDVVARSSSAESAGEDAIIQPENTRIGLAVGDRHFGKGVGCGSAAGNGIQNRRTSNRPKSTTSPTANR